MIYQVLYWHDPCGNEEMLEFEIEEIKKFLKTCGVTYELEETDLVPIYDSNEKYFDILFFDWGGMSIGNSCMEHFCHDIVEHAENHPSRWYCMVSAMTAFAMKAAREEWTNPPENVFIDTEEFEPYLKALK